MSNSPVSPTPDPQSGWSIGAIGAWIKKIVSKTPLQGKTVSFPGLPFKFSLKNLFWRNDESAKNALHNRNISSNSSESGLNTAATTSQVAKPLVHNNKLVQDLEKHITDHPENIVQILARLKKMSSDTEYQKLCNGLLKNNKMMPDGMRDKIVDSYSTIHKDKSLLDLHEALIQIISQKDADDICRAILSKRGGVDRILRTPDVKEWMKPLRSTTWIEVEFSATCDNIQRGLSDYKKKLAGNKDLLQIEKDKGYNLALIDVFAAINSKNSQAVPALAALCHVHNLFGTLPPFWVNVFMFPDSNNRDLIFQPLLDTFEYELEKSEQNSEATAQLVQQFDSQLGVQLCEWALKNKNKPEVAAKIANLLAYVYVARTSVGENGREQLFTQQQAFFQKLLQRPESISPQLLKEYALHPDKLSSSQALEKKLDDWNTEVRECINPKIFQTFGPRPDRFSEFFMKFEGAEGKKLVADAYELSQHDPVVGQKLASLLGGIYSYKENPQKKIKENRVLDNIKPFQVLIRGGDVGQGSPGFYTELLHSRSLGEDLKAGQLDQLLRTQLKYSRDSQFLEKIKGEKLITFASIQEQVDKDASRGNVFFIRGEKVLSESMGQKLFDELKTMGVEKEDVRLNILRCCQQGVFGENTEFNFALFGGENFYATPPDPECFIRRDIIISDDNITIQATLVSKIQSLTSDKDLDNRLLQESTIVIPKDPKKQSEATFTMKSTFPHKDKDSEILKPYRREKDADTLKEV